MGMVMMLKSVNVLVTVVIIIGRDKELVANLNAIFLDFLGIRVNHKYICLWESDLVKNAFI